MKLTKHIPARTHTEQFNWCKKGYSMMGRRWRAIKPAPVNCEWCGHKLEDGESIALAQPEKGRNKVLCENCADALLASAQT